MFKGKKSDTAWYEFLQEFYQHRREHILFIISILIAAAISAVLLNYFLDLTQQLEKGQLKSLDERVTDWMFAFRSDEMTSYVKFITDFGDAMAYVILIPLVGFLLYLRGHRWSLTIQGIIVLISTSLLNIWIKNLISRPRPLEDMRLVEAYSYSFPSGHSMSAIAFYGFLIYLSYKLVRNPWLKVFLILLNSILILSIGLSRVYLGVHYPSDVLAGFAAGLFWLLICIALFRAVKFYRGSSNPLKKEAS